MTRGISATVSTHYCFFPEGNRIQRNEIPGSSIIALLSSLET